MSPHALLSVPPRLARRVRERLARGGDDDGGFVLMETMVALTLITVIMAAVGVEYVNGIVVSAHQRSAASASQVASSAMSDLRSLDSSDLLNGRTSTGVAAQKARLVAIDKVKTWLSTDPDTLAYNNAAAPDGAPVPTSYVEQAASAETFRVEKYLECQTDATITTNPDGTTKQASCGSSAGTNTVRAVVAVVWFDRGCPTVGCAFVTSSLIDAHANPTFDLNQKLPSAPAVQAPGDQAVAVGDEISLQLLVQDGKGAAPFTWALTSGSLPTGLSISPAGLVSGTVGGATTTNTATVTVTDAFLRKADATIKWTVAPRLVLGAVADQKNVTTDTVSVALTATGGSGTGYSYTDPGSTLPAGLTLDASTGRITGSPTKVGTSSVTLTVTDSGKRTATTSFTWNVTNPPIAVTNPGAQVATKDRPESVKVTASGGSGTYTYRATGLPTGLTINASTGLISGTPTGTGSSSITVTVTDDAATTARTVTFTMNVVSGPTIETPGPQSSTRGGTARLDDVATCPNGPCTFSAGNLPRGLSIDSVTGTISGTIASTATTSTTATVTITDAAGATATTGAFRWNINNPPTATAPDDRTTARSTNVNTSFAGAFAGGTGPYTYSATGLPAGLSINAGTGVVTGTTANTNTKQSPRITVTDASGVSVTTTFDWYVTNLTLSMPGSSIARGSSGQRNLATAPYTTGGSTPYTYTVDNLPPGFSLTGTTVSGAGTTRGTYQVTVTVVDGVGASLTVNWTFVVT